MNKKALAASSFRKNFKWPEIWNIEKFTEAVVEWHVLEIEDRDRKIEDLEKELEVCNRAYDKIMRKWRGR